MIFYKDTINFLKKENKNFLYTFIENQFITIY